MKRMLLHTSGNKGGGGQICHFLKPLKPTQELKKMSYSSELWYGSCSKEL